MDLDISAKDLIPVIDIDFAIEDARALYEQRGPVLYMSNPWWIGTNRHLLINHLCKLYQYCLKHKLPYKDAVRFSNRTVYHMYPTARVVVREISQSIGSVTLRAHFRNLHEQFGAPQWSEIFALERRFWQVQKQQRGLDSFGAIVKNGGKRSYILWETLHSVVGIGGEKKLAPFDLLDFTLSTTKVMSPARLGASLGYALTKTVPFIHSQLPRIRMQPIFAGAQSPADAPGTDQLDWLEQIGLKRGVRLIAGTLPLGFFVTKEHLGAGGSMEDVIEIAPSGEYRTRSGSIFFGDFWFKETRNPWLVVQVGPRNVGKVNLDQWYDPGQYTRTPTLQELQHLDPDGPWTKVWDRATGAPISTQAGRISLKSR